MIAAQSEESMAALGISGIGIVSGGGIGKDETLYYLKKASHNFHRLRRPHRQHASSHFYGLECDDQAIDATVADFSSPLRTASLSTKAAVAVLKQAWQEAQLDQRQVDPMRIGLVIGGSNFQQGHLLLLQERYRDKPVYLRSHYGFSYLDTDMLGVLTELFHIEGEAYVLGGASASGQLAVIHAARLVQQGCVDIGIAVGALTDLSYWELQGLSNMGALAVVPTNQKYESCPFDQNHCGLTYGEGSAAVIIERVDPANRHQQSIQIAGWGISIDGNRNPNPSSEGQARSIEDSMAMADIQAESVDYINPHGSGSQLGDQTELATLKQLGLHESYINASKAYFGHCLMAAGALEIVLTVLQMRHHFLHGTPGLNQPIDNTFRWVKDFKEKHKIRCALCLSYGFSGINTSIILK